MEEAERMIESCIKNKVSILDLSYLGLTELPENLPNSLQRLYCSDNSLTELPVNLPNLLQTLDCSNNSLTELPLILFNKTVYCNNKSILFQRRAKNRIIRWYEYRKNIRRIIKTSRIYNSTTLPKNICHLIACY